MTCRPHNNSFLRCSVTAGRQPERGADRVFQHLAMAAVAIWLCFHPSAALAASTAPVAPDAQKLEHAAQLTEAKGHVYKRGFVDWTKETWGDPEPAKKGDKLHEGMQVGTGDKSWAQLTWKHVNARAWSNSVYAVAPNQRLVYLLNGEMLFQLDKNRKDKSAYMVWTNLIQARIRGTTVLLQSTGNVSRVSVLEGTVDVMNRKDHSVVRITPGVVYEVKTSDQSSGTDGSFAGSIGTLMGDKSGQLSAASQAASSTALGAAKTEGIGSLTNIVAPGSVPIPLFQTAETVTSLLAGSVSDLLSHPLVQSLETALPSLSLVQTELGKVASSPVAVGSAVSGILAAPQIVADNAGILRVPTHSSYNLGPHAGKDISLPAGALYHWPPAGILGTESNGLVSVLSSKAASLAPGALGNGEIGRAGGHPLGNALSPATAASLPGLTAGFGATTGAGLLNSTASGLIGPSLPGGGAVGGALSGVGGVVSGAGGALGGAGGALGGVGGALGGVGGALGGVGGGLGGLLP